MIYGYGTHSVRLSVCVSVTTKSAAYLVFTSKGRCRRVLHGVFKILASLGELSMAKRVIASFQLEKCV